MILANILVVNILTTSSHFGLKHHKFIRSNTFKAMTTVGLQNLKFDNRNIRNLPIDTNTEIYSRQVPNSCFSLVNPTPVKNPVLVAKSQAALDLLGLVSDVDEMEMAKYFGGNAVLPGSTPAAHCYCGHQFGNFAGQLGDGATMYLGEVLHPATNERWELQLKGAGKTPYSRTADGRKVLRSTVREFLGSEGLHYLGIATTRAGTCVTSDSTVERDPYYDGTVIDERCSIVSRIAPNFFRFGSFEIFKGPSASEDRVGPSAGNEALKKVLFDHVLSYYPDLTADHSVNSVSASSGDDNTGLYISFFREIMVRTINLVVGWQGVGFVHGVLNTDNMSVMGLTIDYGPFGFIDHFDKEYVPNGSDGSGRYSYANQPSICRWNLMKFAEVLAPLLPAAKAEQVLSDYDSLYAQAYYKAMRRKFGLVDGAVDGAADGTVAEKSAGQALIDSFFVVMQQTSCDFTDAFVALTEHAEALLELQSGATTQSAEDLRETLLNKLVSRCASPQNIVASGKRKIRVHRLGMNPGQIQYLWDALQKSPAEVAKMFGNAPIEAIRGEIEGEKKKLDILVQTTKDIKRHETLGKETKDADNRNLWSAWCVEYHNRVASLPVSVAQQRLQAMRGANPTFVLRNWIAQDVIAAAEVNSFEPTRSVLRMLETPFNPDFSSFKTSPVDGNTCAAMSTTDFASSGLSDLERKYCSVPPEWSDGLLCTCSS